MPNPHQNYFIHLDQINLSVMVHSYLVPTLTFIIDLHFIVFFFTFRAIISIVTIILLIVAFSSN